MRPTQFSIRYRADFIGACGVPQACVGGFFPEPHGSASAGAFCGSGKSRLRCRHIAERCAFTQAPSTRFALSLSLPSGIVSTVDSFSAPPSSKGNRARRTMQPPLRFLKRDAEFRFANAGLGNFLSRVRQIAIIILSCILVFYGSLFFYVLADVLRLPPKESKLIQNFHAHRAAFERLRDMLVADQQLIRLASWGVETTNNVVPTIPPEGELPCLRSLQGIHDATQRGRWARRKPRKKVNMPISALVFGDRDSLEYASRRYLLDGSKARKPDRYN